jgi:hypothetical protein
MSGIFVTLIIAVLIAGVLYWLLTFLPIPEPFNRLAQGLIVIGLIFYIILTLWGARGALPH